MDNGHILALTGAELDAALKNAQNALPRDGSAPMTGDLKVPSLTLAEKTIGAYFYDGGNHNLVIRAGDPTTGEYTYFGIEKDNRVSVGGNNILHTGNKPSGSYTGNGSAAERTIETGGIGKCCVVYGGTDEMACVTPIGAFFQAGGNVKFTSDVTFDGALHIRNAHIINSASTTYNYQVL